MILHHGVNFQRRATFRRVLFGYSPPEDVVRGHDINGKRFYKQLNPSKAFACRRALIFVVPEGRLSPGQRDSIAKLATSRGLRGD
jgi:hypothetical protein